MNFLTKKQEQKEPAEPEPRSATELFKKMKQKVLFAARMIAAANNRKKDRIKGSLNDIDNSTHFLQEKITEFFKKKRIHTEDIVLTKAHITSLGRLR